MGIELHLEKFLDALAKKITVTKNEMDEIVMPMFLEGWEVKEIYDHIISVRDFNKKQSLDDIYINTEENIDE